MFNLFPRFERGRIMKKELLWALRDYSYESLKIQYQDYSNGILKGLDITVDDDAVVLGTGMVKFDEFIYLITEPVRVPYEATNEYVCLKGRVNVNSSSPDAILYGIDFVLDSELGRKENEFEVCRFKLRQGAKLRNHYKAFYDIETEYDTVNLAQATWSGVGEETMSPVVLKNFAEEIKECGNVSAEDWNFCFCILNRNRISRSNLLFYIKSKHIDIDMEAQNKRIFQELEMIIRKLSGKSMKHGIHSVPVMERIIVD